MGKHPGGRPLKKYKEIKDIPKELDKQYIIIEGNKPIKNNEFIKEKMLVDYIVNNIHDFGRDILNDEIISFEVEKDIEKQMCLSPRRRRIDLFIKGKNKIYLIECKNPKYSSENRSAIGQILDYGREFTDSEKELVIITTMFDLDTAKTIEYYNLPIRYIYISKKHILEYKGVEGI